ncbi:MAG: hypothetical protein V1806_08060 [Pseudomonadota bacterium]
MPGMVASLSGLCFQVDSKTVWSGHHDLEDARAYTRNRGQDGLAPRVLNGCGWSNYGTFTLFVVDRSAAPPSSGGGN